MTELGQPNGKLKDLPETGGTTMWYENHFNCPKNPMHHITGSTRRLYCAECGTWWWRAGWEVSGEN